jgi:hypothetical protein
VAWFWLSASKGTMGSLCNNSTWVVPMARSMVRLEVLKLAERGGEGVSFWAVRRTICARPSDGSVRRST